MKKYFYKDIDMDIVVIKLIEKHLLPFDVVLYLNEFVKSEKLYDVNIKKAVEMWIDNKKMCIFRYGHISDWDVSMVTNMFGLFYNITFFNDDISKWNTYNVINMDFMFNGATDFNGDLSKWNVSNVVTMCYLFSEAISFNSNLYEWDVSNVKDMDNMFSFTKKLNSDISKWNVSNVVIMKSMFYYAENFNCDLSKWNVSNVKDVSYMFYNAKKFHYILNWSLTEKTFLINMLHGTKIKKNDLKMWRIPYYLKAQLLFDSHIGLI